MTDEFDESNAEEELKDIIDDFMGENTTIDDDEVVKILTSMNDDASEDSFADMITDYLDDLQGTGPGQS